MKGQRIQIAVAEPVHEYVEFGISVGQDFLILLDLRELAVEALEVGSQAANIHV